MAKQYKVLGHDNIFRYRVVSSSRPGEVEHVVDVSAHRGIGECSCEHFVYRILPTIESDNLLAIAKAHGAPLRCSHIVAARETCLDALIQLLEAKAETIEKKGGA
jgi:hypothetical protein